MPQSVIQAKMMVSPQTDSTLVMEPDNYIAVMYSKWDSVPMAVSLICVWIKIESSVIAKASCIFKNLLIWSIQF